MCAIGDDVEAEPHDSPLFRHRFLAALRTVIGHVPADGAAA
jgi:hypothetical protein